MARPGLMRMVWACMVAVVVSCGGDDATFDTTTTSTPEVDVVASLIAPEALGEGWSITTPPGGVGPEFDGAVTDAQQNELPRPELCDEASEESRDTIENLRWQAFRSLELDVADPIRPPVDRTGHLVFLQELITQGAPGEMRAAFDLLRQGFTDCLGDIPAGEEGPGRADLVSVPAVGDDRFGVLLTFEEAGGWAQWRIHQVLVLDGPALVSLLIGDIRSVDVEPYFTVADIEAIVTTAADAVRSRTSP